jgi:hypothetical protein
MLQYGTTLWTVGIIAFLTVAVKAFTVRRRRLRALAAAERQELRWPARESSDYWEPTQPDPRGQRAAYRRPGNPVAVRLINAFDQPRQGWVLDRSSAGVRLAADGPVDIGRRFLVLPDAAPAGTAPVEVEVRWCEEQPDHYQLGGRFTSPLPVTVLLLFG